MGRSGREATPVGTGGQICSRWPSGLVGSAVEERRQTHSLLSSGNGVTSLYSRGDSSPAVDGELTRTLCSSQMPLGHRVTPCWGRLCLPPGGSVPVGQALSSQTGMARVPWPPRGTEMHLPRTSCPSGVRGRQMQMGVSFPGQSLLSSSACPDVGKGWCFH